MNKIDYTSGETVGQLIDRLGHFFSAIIETAKDRFLNMPAEKLITILVMVAIMLLFLGGLVVLEIYVKDKLEQRRLRQKQDESDDRS